MAYYENLPIYKAAFDLTTYMEKIVHNFSRYHKYTVGTDLRNVSRKILLLVAKANIKQDRKACLTEVLEKLDELKILVTVYGRWKKEYKGISGLVSKLFGAFQMGKYISFN
jgi:hypothetical protein